MNDGTLADALNRSCHCISVDQGMLQQSLAEAFGDTDAYVRLVDKRPHLLAESPVFVSREHIGRMQAVIEAIERVTALEEYRRQALEWAPQIAHVDHGPRGVFFGYDFHLANDGPRLIEVNTNAGGALLLLHLARAQKACCEAVEPFIAGPVDLEDIEQEFVAMFREELAYQNTRRSLDRVAIVDEAPGAQFLEPEFTLFRQMFARFGIEAVIAGPGDLEIKGASLCVDGQAVDLVYNRLTDFYLQSDSCRVLEQAYRAGAVAVTPGPRAHALYADKRNLTLLGDDAFLRDLGADAATRRTLSTAIPRACLVTPDNAADLWSRRRRLFFKPVWGFGSRGTYKGAKLTKKTWASILESRYIAQELVPPSERLLVVDGEHASLKVDVRCFTYRGKLQLIGARLYRGQTTNFRTDGGGLATVFTTPAP